MWKMPYNWLPERVEAYTASWIEMQFPYRIPPEKWSRLIQPRGLKCSRQQRRENVSKSRLIQPRGLKSVCIETIPSFGSRGLYSLVD